MGLRLYFFFTRTEKKNPNVNLAPPNAAETLPFWDFSPNSLRRNSLLAFMGADPIPNHNTGPSKGSSCDQSSPSSYQLCDTPGVSSNAGGSWAQMLRHSFRSRVSALFRGANGAHSLRGLVRRFERFSDHYVKAPISFFPQYPSRNSGLL